MKYRLERGEEEKGSGGSTLREPRCARAQLTPRDEAALAWIVEQRVATVGQVQRLLAQLTGTDCTDRRTRQIIARWEELGLAERWRVWHGEQSIVWPTSQAAYITGLSRWRRPGVGTLRHLIAVSEVRLLAAPVGGPRVWVSESELRRTTPTGIHLADGGWTEPNGRSIALEVELTPHGKRRVAAAIDSLLAEQCDGHPRWSGVLYVCATSTVRQVRAVVEAMPESTRSRVQVRDLP